MWMFYLRLCLACAICFLSACTTETPVEKAEVIRPVKLMTVGINEKAAAIELPGSVHAIRETDVAFEVPGRIIDILVKEGDLVATGDILAKLDPRDYESARDRARAQLNASKADYQRYLEASKANAVTQQNVDLAKRNLEVAEADLNTALKALEDTVLRTPYDGRVAKRIVGEFTNVQAKQAVFTLHDESALEVRVSVAERDWVKASPNMSVEQATELLKPKVELSALPGQLFDAQAKSYATAIDPVTRTYEATFTFTAPTDKSVHSGMTAKVLVRGMNEIQQSTSPELRIPASAVFALSDGQPSVWHVDASGLVSKRSVALGTLVNGQLHIQSGLESGEQIALSGVHTLTEGMRVRALKH